MKDLIKEIENAQTDGAKIAGIVKVLKKLVEAEATPTAAYKKK